MPSAWLPTSTSPAARSKQKGSQAPVTSPWTPCPHQRQLTSPPPFQLSLRRRRKPKRLRTTRGPSWMCLRETQCQSLRRPPTGWRTQVLSSTTRETASGSSTPSCPPTCPCAVPPAPFCERKVIVYEYKTTPTCEEGVKFNQGQAGVLFSHCSSLVLQFSLCNIYGCKCLIIDSNGENLHVVPLFH